MLNCGRLVEYNNPESIISWLEMIVTHDNMARYFEIIQNYSLHVYLYH